jgi:hypothetical protein
MTFKCWPILTPAGLETEVRSNMVLSFQKRFQAKILAKEKRHTIRAKRKGKRQIRVGDRLDCYVGLRQKGAYLLGRWPCVRIQDVRIWREHPMSRAKVSIDGERLSINEREQLARSDGFPNFAVMMNFWRGRLPFHGDMIHWDPDRPQDPPRTSQKKQARPARPKHKKAIK